MLQISPSHLRSIKLQACLLAGVVYCCGRVYFLIIYIYFNLILSILFTTQVNVKGDDIRNIHISCVTVTEIQSICSICSIYSQQIINQLSISIYRMSNRHRRTRIYGANYDIGESYYKKQLNDLDNKRSFSRYTLLKTIKSINNYTSYYIILLIL